MKSFTTLAFLGATAQAATTFTLTSEAWKDWTWAVSGWDAGCARSGCNYDFNVTVPANPTLPSIPLNSSVKAYCSGYESDNHFTLCTILTGGELDPHKSVAAKFLPRDSNATDLGPKKVAVSFEISQDGTRFNYTGYADTIYNAFVAPPQNFTLMPTEAYGVA